MAYLDRSWATPMQAPARYSSSVAIKVSENRQADGGSIFPVCKKMGKSHKPTQVFDALVEIGGTGKASRGVHSFSCNGFFQRGLEVLDPFGYVAFVLFQIDLGVDKGLLEFSGPVKGLLPLLVRGLEFGGKIRQIQHRSVGTQILIGWFGHSFGYRRKQADVLLAGLGLMTKHRQGRRWAGRWQRLCSGMLEASAKGCVGQRCRCGCRC
mmetsp:Transcript_11644/g.29465  ORF Transcript_11644/g.29465 Transcript_11644/m.29465 type:complete len:209 (-) Transcript_11644:94-720(-)